MEEIFKDIPGYEGLYQVSNIGRVKSFYTNRLRKLSKDERGYFQIDLFKNHKGKSFKIHKLVAMAFLDHKPCGYDIVINHKDGNQANNNATNLEPTTQRYNASDGFMRSKVKTSSFTGVRLDGRNNYWTSQIKINNKAVFLGQSKNEIEASEMYITAVQNIEKYNGNAAEFRNAIFN